MPKHLWVLAAAVMLLNGDAAAHSWYDESCCHDRDCHPIPCEQIEKLGDGWVWRDMATKHPYWFPHDRLKASRDNACHVCVSPKTVPGGICLYVPLPA
jgi:hypothetical protein